MANKDDQVLRASYITNSLKKKSAFPFEFLALRSASLNPCSKATELFFHSAKVELILLVYSKRNKYPVHLALCLASNPCQIL